MPFLPVCLFALSVCLLVAPARAADSRTDSIATAVGWLMEAYPEATLLDIYKSAFQNRYGPGHIVADAEKAKGYLDWELQQPARHENMLFEPTVYDGSYVRVDLAVIREGMVPYDVFLGAFLESAESAAMPAIEDWTREWNEILEVVTGLYPDLPGLEKDAEAIGGRLHKGIYQGEHSRKFVERYDPHYRIMRREVFESRIAPLVPDRKCHRFFPK